MLILLIASLWTATRDIGGLDGLLAVQPGDSLTLGMAITMIFGTFVSGATQATNWTRFARSQPRSRMICSSRSLCCRNIPLAPL